ncbi:hypothetical protein [Parapedomonas caeni]
MTSMAKRLAYTVGTEGGGRLSCAFPLDPRTRSPEQVGEVAVALVETLDHEARVSGLANGDMLQALAIALALRVGMMEGDTDENTELADALVQEALAAVRARARG